MPAQLYGLCPKCTTGMALMSARTSRNAMSEKETLWVIKTKKTKKEIWARNPFI